MEENFTRICYQADLVSIRPNLAHVLMLREFRSRGSTLLESLVLLKDEDVSWITVDPMIGMGRTRLDESVVSHAQAVSRIQDEIASSLGFRLDHEETQRIRPEEIYEKLRRSKVKKVVITLVDDSISFDLLSIGFLDRDRRVACKVLLTSSDIIQAPRNSDLEMGIIPMATLPKEEAFLLFNQIVGQTKHTDLVWKIVDTCPGLSLVIDVIAHKLRGRPLSEWELALQTLRKSLTESELDPGMLSSIKLSNYEEGWERCKFMFLLCTILEQQIFYKDLIKYGSSLFFEHVLGITATMQLVYGMMSFLKRRNLLLDGKTGEYVSMSKICLDLAKAVASGDPDWFIVRQDGGAIKWPENNILAQVRYISLQVNNCTLELPKGLLLPYLDLLHVYDEDGSLQIADNFFKGMNKKGRKVLALIKIQLLSLPSSLLDLTNIDTLCLDYCVLGDISKIGELQSLRVLSLSHTSIEQLPIQIGQLTRLTMLDLSNCLNLKVFPPNILSRLTNLEFFLMRNSFADWRVGDRERDKASLGELTSLTSLHAFEIQILNPEMIPKALPWGTWNRYNIVIGQDFECPSEKHETSKVLKWNHNNSPNGWMKSLLNDCEELWLRKSKGIEKVLWKLQHLEHLYIQDNDEMEYLTNFEVLHDRGISSDFHFRHLRMLRIEDCLSLRFVFETSARECLHNLKELDVSGCENIYAIFINNNQRNARYFDFMRLNGLQSLTLRNLDKLVVFLSFDHVRPLLDKVDLPILKHLKLVKIPRIRHVITLNRIQLEYLESLEIDECNNLYQIFSVEEPECPIQLCVLGRLNQLKVCNCNQLRYLLPHYFLKNLELLQQIDVSNCSMLEQVFLYEEDMVMIGSEKKVLPSLRSLKLRNLPVLANICSAAPHLITLHLNQMTIEDCPRLPFTFAQSQTTSLGKSEEIIIVPSQLLNLNLRTHDHLKRICNDHLISFIHLTSLQLYGCDKLEYLFPLSVTRSLSSLQELKIISCKIIENILMRGSDVDTIEFPWVTTLILEKLPKFSEFCQNDCMVKWPSLNKLRVVACPSIKRSILGVVDRSLLNSVEVIDCKPWENENLGISVIYLFDCADESHMYLKIEGSHQLNKYLTMPHLFSSFTELKMLEARECDKELNKLLSILLRRSEKFESLTVEKCELLEQIFDLEGFDIEGKGRFPNLNSMILSDLPKLNCVWNKDPSGIIDLRRLVKLKIIKCGSTRNLVSIVVVENLVQLEELYMDSCEMIEEVVTIKVRDVTENQGRWFPKLKNLHLLRLPNFVKFNLQNLNFRFSNLLSLTIEHCPKMNAFTTGFLSTQAPDISDSMKIEIEDAYSELQSLKLVGLQTYEIWQGCISTESFCELKELELGNLSNVEYIFPSNMLPRLEKLKKLTVRNCSSLSSVFQLTGNNSIMYAQNLEIIQLKGCDSLRHLQLLPFTKLKEVEISECRILEEIFMETGEQVIDAKILLHLESFVLEKLPMLRSSSLETVEFPSLVKVRIADSPTLTTFKPRPTRNVAGKLKNINQEPSLELLPLLDELVLSELPNMQLWELEPQIPVFTNLTSLEIIRCNNIQKLFSISVAENLHALKMLKFYGCQKLVQVLHGGGGNSKKVFQKLECLILKHLPNLTSFCEQDFAFEFPHLQMVRVEGIPKMKTFVKGSLMTPKLEAVYVIFIKKYWQGNLNTTIKYLNENQDELKAKVDCAVNNFRLSTMAAESSSEKKNHSAAMSSSLEDSYSSSSCHSQ